MSAPNLQYPPASGGGTPVGGSGTVNTLPIWVASSTLDNSAITQVAGSILSLTGLVGGAGYASVSSAIVSLGGGTGTGATAQFVPSAGAVAWVALKNPGSGYTPGDVLTIPGGTGTITVLAVVPKNDAIGHVTAQRIGAGTTQPGAGIDTRLGASLSGLQTHVVEFRSGVFNAFQGAQFNNVTGAPPNSTTVSVYSAGHLVNADLSGFSGGSASIIGQNHWVTATASGGTGNHNFSGVTASAARSYAADTNTNVQLTGGSFSVSEASNSYTTTAMTAVSALAQCFSSASGTVATSRCFGAFSSHTAPVTVTEHHAFDTSGTTLSGGAVITNLYGLRLRAYTVTAPSVIPTNYYPHAQEDTLGRNYFRSPTFFGSAIGTARSASNPSVEVEAVAGVSSGDVRLRSSSAVFDASNSSTNGTKYFNRAGAGISSTTQSYYEEGSYTPTTTGGWTGTLAGTWTRVGRKVFITINTTGSPNGSTGASTLTLPAGLAPARGGAGIRVKTASGTALGNGVVSVDNVSGLIQISTAVTSDNDAKTIQCEYEV
jgi:hypothetical protein